MGRFFRKAETIFGAGVKKGLFIKKKDVHLWFCGLIVDEVYVMPTDLHTSPYKNILSLQQNIKLFLHDK